MCCRPGPRTWRRSRTVVPRRRAVHAVARRERSELGPWRPRMEYQLGAGGAGARHDQVEPLCRAGNGRRDLRPELDQASGLPVGLTGPPKSHCRRKRPRQAVGPAADGTPWAGGHQRWGSRPSRTSNRSRRLRCCSRRPARIPPSCSPAVHCVARFIVAPSPRDSTGQSRAGHGHR